MQKKRINVVSNYIKEKGMENILLMCNNNLCDVKNHLKRECKLPPTTNLYIQICKFKKFLEERMYKKYGNNVDTVILFLKENFKVA